MKNRLRNGIAFALLPQIGLILWIRGKPDWVEAWYSNGFYIYASSFFRRLYGWIPFSVGDCLYAILMLYCITYLVKNRLKIQREPLAFLRNIVVVLSVAYFSFNILWGLNYYRKPLHTTLGLQEKYTTAELLALTNRLVAQTNALQFSLTHNPNTAVKLPYDRKAITDKIEKSYRQIQKTYPFLTYPEPSIKSSLFSTLLTYMGFGGYLNPFTNEAQVNRKIPTFRYPVICGHEIGHQLGYSAENETNFIGYLVTASSDDPYIRYSAAAFAASYCLAEIHRRDVASYKHIYAGFNLGVQENFRELEAFWKSYENPLEPLFKSIFNTFLKANNQSEGIRSYNGIVSLLVNYHRKHPL